MGNVNQIFRSFYDRYDFNTVRRAYGHIVEKSFFSELYKTVPFAVELRMKNDVFAM